MSSVITPTSTEGEIGVEFDFEQWVKMNNLEEAKAMLIKHGMNTKDSISTNSKSFVSLMGELSTTKPLLVSTVICAIQNLTSQTKTGNDAKPKHIIVSEEEHAVMDKIESDLKEMNEFEVNIKSLNKQLPESLIKIKEEKLRQIDNTKRKIADTFDSIEKALVISQANVSNALMKIKTDINDDDDDAKEGDYDCKEAQMLRQSTEILNEERNNLTEKLQECHHKVESIGNNKRRERKQQIINIGREAQSQFQKTKQRLNDNIETVKDVVNKNQKCVIKIDFMVNDNYKRKILKLMANMGQIIDQQYQPDETPNIQCNQPDEYEIVIEKFRSEIKSLKNQLKVKENEYKQLQNNFQKEKIERITEFNNNKTTKVKLDSIFKQLEKEKKLHLQSKERGSKQEKRIQTLRQQNIQLEFKVNSWKELNDELKESNEELEESNDDLKLKLRLLRRNEKKYNGQGREMKKGNTGKYYCGTYFGRQYSGHDGHCGPNNGRECSSCARYNLYH
eukprot:329915_1